MAINYRGKLEDVKKVRQYNEKQRGVRELVCIRIGPKTSRWTKTLQTLALQPLQLACSACLYLVYKLRILLISLSLLPRCSCPRNHFLHTGCPAACYQYCIYGATCCNGCHEQCQGGAICLSHVVFSTIGTTDGTKH